MNDNETLASYLHAVAYQRGLMRPWLDDKHFVKNGGKVYYAVDSDIVKLYTAPEENSVPFQNRKEGYAQIFPDDDSNLSIAIGRALADYIFNHLTEEVLPLLIIPPLEDELRLIYAAIARDAEREQQQANTEVLEMRKTLCQLGNELNDEVLLDKLKETAPQVMSILSGSGFTAEFRRFNNLLTNTRIAPPEFVLKHELIADEKMRYALMPVKDIDGWLRIFQLMERWRRLLKEAKSPQTTTLETDAKAMARLEWINLHLNEQNQRLVYITGDISLYKAARMHKVNQNNVNRTFADLYLRHLRAYLAEKYILSVPTGDTIANENQFVESLDTFLVKFQLGSKNNSVKALDDLLEEKAAVLVEMVKPILETNPDIVQKFKDSWNEYTQNLVITYGSRRTPEEGILNDVKALKNDLEKLIERVQDKLKDKLQESWNDFFSAVTAAGYSLLYDKQHTFQPHCAPLLIFNSLLKTQDFAIRILSSHEPGKLDTQYYKEVIDKLTDEDPSGYSFYLAYALLFAQTNAWHISAIMTARAINIAETCQQWNISGREAYYLRAVTLRHSARRIGDLANLQSLLNKAEECLEEDRSRRNSKLPGGTVRFEAERISINLSYNLFNFFNEEILPENVPNLERMQGMVEQQLNQLGEKENDDRVKRNVERSLLTIMFMILFLRWEKEKMPLEPVYMRRYSDQFRENIKLENFDNISFLVEVVSMIAEWWTNYNKLERKKLRKKIQDLLHDYSIQNHTIFPYDVKLYHFLREIVERPIE